MTRLSHLLQSGALVDWLWPIALAVVCLMPLLVPMLAGDGMP